MDYSCDSDPSSSVVGNKERIESEDASSRDDDSCSCSLNDKLDSSSSEQVKPPFKERLPLSQVEELSEPTSASADHAKAHQTSKVDHIRMPMFGSHRIAFSPIPSRARRVRDNRHPSMGPEDEHPIPHRATAVPEWISNDNPPRNQPEESTSAWEDSEPEPRAQQNVQSSAAAPRPTQPPAAMPRIATGSRQSQSEHHHHPNGGTESQLCEICYPTHAHRFLVADAKDFCCHPECGFHDTFPIPQRGLAAAPQLASCVVPQQSPKSKTQPSKPNKRKYRSCLQKLKDACQAFTRESDKDSKYQKRKYNRPRSTGMGGDANPIASDYPQKDKTQHQVPPTPPPTPPPSYSNAPCGPPGLPGPCCCHHKKCACQKKCCYVFDHGHNEYLVINDKTPELMADVIARETDAFATKFWAGIFGALHIPFAFIYVFILQLIRFLLIAIVRPLLVDTIAIFSDYFFKPFLCALFSSVLQPICALLYNVAKSVRNVARPMAEIPGTFLAQLALLIRAFRLFEINQFSSSSSREKQRCTKTYSDCKPVKCTSSADSSSSDDCQCCAFNHCVPPPHQRGVPSAGVPPAGVPCEISPRLSYCTHCRLSCSGQAV